MSLSRRSFLGLGAALGAATLHGNAAHAGSPVTVAAAPTTAWLPYSGSTDLTYEIRPLPASWNAVDIVAGIKHCLDAVSAVTPLQFTQVSQDADLTFSFTGEVPPTTPGQPPTALPSWAPALTVLGVITYDPGRKYSAQTPTPAGAIDFIAVTLHEIGDFLGLSHSPDPTAVMYPTWPMGSRRYGADDIQRLQARFGGRREQVPGEFGANAVGVDVAVLPGSTGNSLVVAHIDDLEGPNQGKYRVGWALDGNGVPTGGWSPVVDMGGPIGHSTQGLGIAIGDVTGGPGPDLVMVWMDAREGENQAFYRIGTGLDGLGLNAAWTGADHPIPGWFGSETDGVAAALGDLDNDGKAELVVAWIDDPNGQNTMYLTIGRSFGAGGAFNSWSEPIAVPGLVMGAASGGLGIALTDLRGNGRPDLVLFWIDDPDGGNAGLVMIGWDLDPAGRPLGGWSDAYTLKGWWGDNTVDAGLAVASIRGFARPDLVAINLDERDDNDEAFYRVLASGLPLLPVWQPVRPLAPPGTATTPGAEAGPGIVDRLTAIASVPNYYHGLTVVGLGITAEEGPQDVLGAFWDMTNLDTHDGSGILDFVTSKVPSPTRRSHSPLAAAAVPRDYLSTTVYLLWIDTANRISTAAAVVPAGGHPPVWSAPSQLVSGPIARAATATVPGSPLATASIDDQHICVVVAGPNDQISADHWDRHTGWRPPTDLVGPWTPPVTAIVAVARIDQQQIVEVYWLDGEGAIWAATTTSDSVWKPAERIFLPGTARHDSPLAVLSPDDAHVDLFWIGPGGDVMTSAYSGPGPSTTPDGDGWATPFGIDGGRRAEKGSSLAAVLEDTYAKRKHVFWEGSGDVAQALVTAWWGPYPGGDPAPWSPPVVVTPRASLLPGTDIAAAVRDRDHVRVIFINQEKKATQLWWGTLP